MAFFVTAVAVAVEVGTLATIATAVMEVGMALQVVGAITGSKDLMKVGGYMSMAGGVGSLAAGAMTAAGSAAATDAAATAGTDALTSDALAGAGYQAADYGAAPALENMTADAFSTGGAAATDAAVADTAATATDLSAATAASSAAPAAAPAAASTTPTALPDGAQQAAQMAGKLVSPTAPTTAGSPGTNPDGSLTPPTDTSQNGIVSWFKGLDPKMQSTVLQGAAGAVGGLFNGWTAEQKLALEQNKFNFTQQQYNTGVANANAQPIVAFKPVTNTGLINSVAKA